MATKLSILLLITSVGWRIAAAQDVNDLELARRLANPSTRAVAVAEVTASGAKKAELLLRWAEKPPVDVNRTELFIGLADVFGELRTKEAIPFLIQNISIARWVRPNIWMKAPDVVQGHLPAVAALIKIGAEASRALIHTRWERMPAEDHLAAIFVVSMIQDPEARDFLLSAIGEANTERYRAEEGLKLLGNAGKVK